MTKINRSNFLQQYANKELRLNDLGQQGERDLRAAGTSLQNVRRSDLNNDGKIAGTSELNHLFNHIDDFDRNGTRRSIDHKTNNGQLTRAGRVYNALSLQFAEASDATEVTSTTTPSPTSSLGQLWASGGKASVEEKMGAHRRSIDETGVGLYYGDHSSMKGMSLSEKQNWIDRHAIAGTNPPRAADLKQSSCIGWAMENVGEAYKSAGKTQRWNQIKRIVQRDGMRGTTLAKELKKDGWESVYWNPDTKKNADGNAEHSFSALQVRRGKPYYGIKVDHQVTNYRPASGSSTSKDMSGIDKLKDVPFFFGLAKGGMHTFVGTEGKVNEFHWADMPDNPEAIEETPLEDFGWLSGVIMVPPGTWND